jgi:hypothetical protein
MIAVKSFWLRGWGGKKSLVINVTISFGDMA